MANTKNKRREVAIKKAKSKKIITVSICVVLTAIVLMFAVFAATQENKIETYSNGIKMVQLLPDGNFSATLAHNVRKNGTYEKAEENIMFNVNGRTETGRIINNELHIPDEWDDNHNHGKILPRR
jgi:flagellar basal body-associated protein FliL